MLLTFQVSALGTPRLAVTPHRQGWKGGATPQPQRGTAHYVVGNADDSNPGTFKDRVLMEEDPYAQLEALTVRPLAMPPAPAIGPLAVLPPTWLNLTTRCWSRSLCP